MESHWSHLNFEYRACSKQEGPEIQATIKCEFTLKYVRDTTRTYIQIDQINTQTTVQLFGQFGEIVEC